MSAGPEFERDDEFPPPPRRNPELHGHGGAEGALLEAFNGGRLAHAWLISGPWGVGKATLAYRFARFVLAAGGADLLGGVSPPGVPDSLHLAPEHPVFHRVGAGAHVDLMTVERTLNDKGKMRGEIVVDDVRAVGGFLSLTAGEGGWRVVVVDSADEMNVHAANALLKVLEEPPDRALLLLVSHNPGRLLATIRSRCRKLALQPLPDDRVASLIQPYLSQCDGGDVSALARLADGSPGRALALAAEGGLELYRDMTDLLETLPDLDIGRLHAFGGRLGKAGGEEAFRTAGELLQWWLARLIVAAAGASEAAAAPAEEAVMGRMVKAAGLDRWLEVWEKINHLLARTDSANLDRKQVVLNVFLTLENAVRT